MSVLRSRYGRRPIFSRRVPFRGVLTPVAAVQAANRLAGTDSIDASLKSAVPVLISPNKPEDALIARTDVACRTELCGLRRSAELLLPNRPLVYRVGDFAHGPWKRLAQLDFVVLADQNQGEAARPEFATDLA